MKKSVILMFLAMGWQATPGLTAVQDDIRSDSQKTAKWFSEQVAPAMAFQAASAPTATGDVCKFLGVEVGLSGALTTTKVDVDKFRSLNFQSINNAGGEINLPNELPVPVALLQARMGIIWDMDLGIKLGTLNANQQESDSNIDVDNKVYGVEIRRRLMGGGVTSVAVPDLAVSLAYDKSSGKATRTERYNAPLQGGGSLDADTTWKSDWNTGAFSAKAVISKGILIFTPYAGLGYIMENGSADTTVSVSGTATPGGAVNESAHDSAPANKSLFTLMGGTEITFLPLVHLNLGYLWSEDDWSATAGLNFRFR